MTRSVRTTTEMCIGSIRASHIADLIRIGEETNLSPWTANSYVEELKNPRCDNAAARAMIIRRSASLSAGS